MLLKKNSNQGPSIHQNFTYREQYHFKVLHKLCCLLELWMLYVMNTRLSDVQYTVLLDLNFTYARAQKATARNIHGNAPE